jgi:hypothetical protein
VLATFFFSVYMKRNTESTPLPFLNSPPLFFFFFAALLNAPYRLQLLSVCFRAASL